MAARPTSTTRQPLLWSPSIIGAFAGSGSGATAVIGREPSDTAPDQGRVEARIGAEPGAFGALAAGAVTVTGAVTVIADVVQNASVTVGAGSPAAPKDAAFTVCFATPVPSPMRSTSPEARTCSRAMSSSWYLNDDDPLLTTRTTLTG